MMRYPRAMSRQADEILARRRQAAQEQHLQTLARLHAQHPELERARGLLQQLYAGHARALFCGGADAAELAREIEDQRARIAGLMKNAGITETNLLPPYTCPVCGDRGSTGGRMCGCREALLNQLVYQQLCDVSPIRECGFANYDLGQVDAAARSEMGRVLESCQRYARDFGRKSRNLLFWGPPGLGKTHLSLAIAGEVTRMGRLVMYASTPHLIGQLEQGRFQKAEEALEYRDMIFECDLLVMDDLGTELVTRYTQAEVYDLINTRLNTDRPTIINTNLTLARIEKTYSERVASRIAGMYAMVQFKGRDIRLQKYERQA